MKNSIKTLRKVRTLGDLRDAQREELLWLVVPVATIAIPLVKLVPALLRWRVRQRLLYWYSQLKQLEHRIASEPPAAELDQHRSDLGRISAAFERIPIPVGFSDQYYSLRAAIDLVRQRIEALASAPA